MKHALTILFLLGSVPASALDYLDIDYLVVQYDNHDCGVPFAETQTVLSSIASGENYFAHVTQPPTDFHIQNPGLDTLHLYLVIILPQGGQSVEYIKVPAGLTRSIDAAVLQGADEYYLISMQNFRLDLVYSNGTKRQSVQNPFNPDLDFIRIRTPQDVVVMLGVDAENKVHYIAYGNIIGDYDASAGLVRLLNETELPLAAP